MSQADALNQAETGWPLPPASEETPDPLLACLLDGLETVKAAGAPAMLQRR